MKKIILLSAAALCFASCSKDKEDLATDTLVPATIQAETGLDEQQTRATWGIPQQDGTVTKIGVTFDPEDAIDVFEHDYEGKQTFSNTDGTSSQNGNFTGKWHGQEKTGWAAILPTSEFNSVNMDDNHRNTFNFYLPSTQTTTQKSFKTIGLNKEITSYSVSPCRAANIMLGAKTSEKTHTCFFEPVCAYLYFATSKTTTTVNITSVNSDISGNISITTEGQWDATSNFSVIQKSSNITTSANSKEINATGTVVNRYETETETDKNYCEYVVCIYPGEHTLNFKAGDTVLGNIKRTFKAANVYYLGIID